VSLPRLRLLKSLKTWQKGETIDLGHQGSLTSRKVARVEAHTDPGIGAEATPLAYNQCLMAQKVGRTLDLAIAPLLQGVIPRPLEEKGLILSEEGKPSEEGLKLLEPSEIVIEALPSRRTKKGRID